ncbi:hypothetical protein PPOLYM_03323 [Paenibacillus polymyxa]|nr:hypothetical protein PPOLYM_03323 [Paenibacillus polymyxa]
MESIESSLDVGEHSELVPATSNKNYIGYFLGGGSTPEEAGIGRACAFINPN